MLRGVVVGHQHRHQYLPDTTPHHEQEPCSATLRYYFRCDNRGVFTAYRYNLPFKECDIPLGSGVRLGWLYGTTAEVRTNYHLCFRVPRLLPRR